MQDREPVQPDETGPGRNWQCDSESSQRRRHVHTGHGTMRSLRGTRRIVAGWAVLRAERTHYGLMPVPSLRHLRWRPSKRNRRQARCNNGEATQDCEQDAQAPHEPNMTFLTETANHNAVTCGSEKLQTLWFCRSRAQPSAEDDHCFCLWNGN